VDRELSLRASQAQVVPTVLGALSAMAVLWPFALQRLTSPRLLIASILALVVLYELGRSPSLVKYLGPALIAISVLGVLTLGATAPMIDEGQAVAGANLQRYLVLFPLAFTAGALIWRSPSAGRYRSAILMVLLLTAAAAVVEFALQTSFFDRNYRYFVEGGYGRAMLASDHPLVLGSMLALGIPLVAPSEKRSTVVLRTVVLAAGVAATRSLGAIVVGSALAILAVAPNLGRALQARRGLVYGALALAATALVWASTQVWTAEAAGGSSALYSQNYRTALYSLAPQMLREAPLGYGPGSLPPGTWLLYSEFKGVRDVATTIDSEYVYLISEWGFVGLGVGVLVVLLGVRALWHDVNVGLAALGLAAIGLFVAVHPWDTLGAAGAGILGVGLAVVLRGRRQALPGTLPKARST
jgi:hypothetical protein